MRRGPVRVLHVLDSLGAGGIERAVWDLVRLAPGDRVQSRVVTACAQGAGAVLANAFSQRGVYAAASRRLTGGPLRERLLDAAPQWSKDALWSMLGPYQSSPRMAQACGRAGLEWLRFRPDVIHAHACYGLRIGAWLKAWTGTPLVYSVWNRVAQLEAEGAAWVLDDYRRLHPVVDAFTTEATYRHELTELGIDPRKVHVHAGTVDVPALQPYLRDARLHRDAVRARLGIPRDAPIALSVGRLTPSKGHRHSLSALPRIIEAVPELHWVVLGEGEERAALIASARHVGVADHTHLVGYVDDPYPYYAAADIFLRTFELEGDTRASFDAMGYGLPIVAFDTGLPIDYIPSVGHGIRVALGDAAGLADAVVRMARDHAGRRAMGDRGQQYAREHLDVRRALTAFEELYVSPRRTSMGASGPLSRAA
jgi:glycosyltransferase involved in cell wall biosynthesis